MLTGTQGSRPGPKPLKFVLKDNQEPKTRTSCHSKHPATRSKRLHGWLSKLAGTVQYLSTV